MGGRFRFSILGRKKWLFEIWRVLRSIFSTLRIRYWLLVWFSISWDFSSCVRIREIFCGKTDSLKFEESSAVHSTDLLKRNWLLVVVCVAVDFSRVCIWGSDFLRQNHFFETRRVRRSTLQHCVNDIDFWFNLVTAFRHDNERGSQGLEPSLHYLPLDPDSTPKQLWDFLCMTLLMYCSFVEYRMRSLSSRLRLPPWANQTKRIWRSMPSSLLTSRCPSLPPRMSKANFWGICRPSLCTTCGRARRS